MFQKLPRIDAVFVPGGDPGHTRPKVLMALLEKQAENLRRFHPKAQMWVSPQSFSREWFDEFLTLMRAEPAWLAGVVFGPQVRVSLPELRKALPAQVSRSATTPTSRTACGASTRSPTGTSPIR